MKMLNKYVLALGLALSVWVNKAGQAQDKGEPVLVEANATSAQQIEMADRLRQDGKIYVADSESYDFHNPGWRKGIRIGSARDGTVEYFIEDIEPTTIDALVINGGTAWSQPDAPDISAVLRDTRAAGKTVAGICDGTLALARAGLLDRVAHTSNSRENLTPTGYKGAQFYRDQPAAVLDGRIVTAPGTAPVTFMGAVLETLGLRNDELDYYLGLYAAEHRA